MDSVKTAAFALETENASLKADAAVASEWMARANIKMEEQEGASNAKMEELAAENACLQEGVSSAEAKIEALNTSAARLAVENTCLQEGASNAEAEIEALKAEAASLQEGTSNAEAENNSLNALVTEMTAEAGKNASLTASLEKKLAAFEPEVINLKSDSPTTKFTNKLSALALVDKQRRGGSTVFSRGSSRRTKCLQTSVKRRR